MASESVTDRMPVKKTIAAHCSGTQNAYANSGNAAKKKASDTTATMIFMVITIVPGSEVHSTQGGAGRENPAKSPKRG